MDNETEISNLPGGCRLIHLSEIMDERGALTFLQEGMGVPFSIERVFWVWGVPPGKSRGGHAHRTCDQVLFPLGGSFRIQVDDGKSQVGVLMDSPTCGILIPAGVWCNLTEFQEGTVCLTVASHPYSAEDYINSYEDYLMEVNREQ